jgi:hypothetical protein
VFLRQHLFEHADHIQEHVLFRGGLLTALCVAACRQRRRLPFTTAAALVEAKQQLQLTEEPFGKAITCFPPRSSWRVRRAVSLYTVSGALFFDTLFVTPLAHRGDAEPQIV